MTLTEMGETWEEHIWGGSNQELHLRHVACELLFGHPVGTVKGSGVIESRFQRRALGWRERVLKAVRLEKRPRGCALGTAAFAHWREEQELVKETEKQQPER